MLFLIQFKTRRRKGKMKGAIESSTLEDAIVFDHFNEFHEDIVKLILSFVVDAPLEKWESNVHQPVETKSTLTHVIPYVCKTFYDFSRLESFWEPCLRRQLERTDNMKYHWIRGLKRLLPANFQLDKNDDLVQVVLDRIEEKSYKKIYKTVLNCHIRSTYPIFIMPSQIRLGEIYGLHLFEPRYRIMIRELLQSCGNPEEAGNGQEIVDGIKFVDGISVNQPPYLIHACLGGLGPGELACLVQLVWCSTYEYGTADVQLLPVAWVRLDEVWYRPNTGHLFYAKATRV